MQKNKEHVIIIFICILFAILFISNIVFICKYYQAQRPIVEEQVYYDTLNDFDTTKKYYQEINFKKYTKLLEEDLVTIAIVDNSSKTYNRFLEMINKIAFYKRTNIYVLEPSKLSKKNEIKFYELDDSLKELESDYIITIGNGHLISVTSFDTNEIIKVIDNIQ